VDRDRGDTSGKRAIENREEPLAAVIAANSRVIESPVRMPDLIPNLAIKAPPMSGETTIGMRFNID